jgi:hypothetical protein
LASTSNLWPAPLAASAYRIAATMRAALAVSSDVPGLLAEPDDV